LAISTYDGNEVKVTVELEAKNNGWFNNSDEIESLTIDTQQTGSELALSLDNDDVVQAFKSFGSAAHM